MLDESVKLAIAPAGPATERPICIAIVAMGGQGGGVLTSWIVELAESQGWVAQSTSVPGVAQRTGATIYYVEMMRPGENGQIPILAQMPTPGDVDAVLASEYMEAGRSILRGIVTPDRTTLIASNHRTLSISEKMAPGEGIADSGVVTDAVRIVAKNEIIFDMNALAIANGSVISSALFGVLAASGVLQFEMAAYHDVIRKGGKGVEASIRTFDAAVTRASMSESEVQPDQSNVADDGLPASLADTVANDLLKRIHHEIPAEARFLTFQGLQKVVDFQDAKYGAEYLDILKNLHRHDAKCGGREQQWSFTTQAAKYLANAMAYDDLMRVADLKTRSSRRARVESEVGVKGGQVLQTTEFLHPRMEEVASVLPYGIAKWITARKRLYVWMDRRVNKGRRVKTYSLTGFVTLYTLGAMKKIRRRSLRHRVEVEHRNSWLQTAQDHAEHNYQLGVQTLKFRRLIKGYSDTHVRGISKFDRVMATVQTIKHRDDAADWAKRLLAAAVKDASKEQLDGTIKTIETFS